MTKMNLKKLNLPFFTEPEPNCPCLFQPKARDCPSSETTTVWLLPDPALMSLNLQQEGH